MNNSTKKILIFLCVAVLVACSFLLSIPHAHEKDGYCKEHCVLCDVTALLKVLFCFVLIYLFCHVAFVEVYVGKSYFGECILSWNTLFGQKTQLLC